VWAVLLLVVGCVICGRDSQQPFDLRLSFVGIRAPSSGGVQNRIRHQSIRPSLSPRPSAYRRDLVEDFINVKSRNCKWVVKNFRVMFRGTFSFVNSGKACAVWRIAEYVSDGGIRTGKRALE
jgi:hypothetical protein